MGQKEEFLRRLDDSELLELAKSVSKDQIDSRKSRNNLIKIVKASLSLEEIKQKVDGTVNPVKIIAPRSKALTLGGVGQLFFVMYGIVSLILMSLPPVIISLPSNFIGIPVSIIQETAVSDFIEAGPLMVFAVLNMASMAALRRGFSGNKMGLISGSIALASSSLAMSYSIATILGLTYTIVEPPPLEGGNYNLLSTFLQGFNVVLMMLSLALIGVFFVVHCQQFPGGDISLAAGFVYMFACFVSLSVSIQSLRYFLEYGYNYGYSNTFLPVPMVIAGALGAGCFLAQKTTF
jgi:hypothetical protein